VAADDPRAGAADDPYAPPAAALRDEPEPFPRQSVLLTFGWAVITLNAYYAHWLWSRSASLDAWAARPTSPRWAYGALYVASVAGAVLTAVVVALEVVENLDPDLERASDALDRITNLFALILCFVLRGALNRAHAKGAAATAWVNGLALLVFGIYYLQWKINRVDYAELLSERRAAAASPGAPKAASPRAQAPP